MARSGRSCYVRRGGLLVAWLLALAAVAPVAEAGWRDVVSPAKNWQRIKSGVSYCYNGVTGYCTKKVEKAKVDQRKTWGIKYDGDVRTLDTTRLLTVLIHGLDSDNGLWFAMAGLLKTEGQQVAFFSYPNDGAVAASAAMLADDLTALRKSHPGLRVNVIGHSMGSLVARAYIEGDRYAGEIDRFVAIAPPNAGSCWVRGRFALEWHEHYKLWRDNKNWSPVWMFTDGTGQAADDVKPGSKFLTDLNARPRRDGVRYTIVLGTQHACSRMTANATASIGACLSESVWGVRNARSGLAKVETHYRHKSGDGDGVVTLESGRLAGVTDVVLVPADHNALAMSIRGAAPAAWPAVRERIAR
ncbi:MAG TPA: alpha/beta fold hydrolase [Tepidisphaeraceae bacterium]|nr:alpha/beta fold hydrolase [Tepidisphaeraceae bacterium]